MNNCSALHLLLNYVHSSLFTVDLLCWFLFDPGSLPKNWKRTRTANFPKFAQSLTYIHFISLSLSLFSFHVLLGRFCIGLWIWRKRKKGEIKRLWNWAKRMRKVRVFLLKVLPPWISLVLPVWLLIMFLLTLYFINS